METIFGGLAVDSGYGGVMMDGVWAVGLAVACLLVSAPSLASSAGPIAGVSGVPAGGGFPAESTCQMCHMDYSLNPDNDGHMKLSGVPDKYVPGKSYELTMQLSHPDATRWGFQLTAIAKESFLGAGDFTSLPGDRTTQRKAGGDGGRVYIEHGGPGRAATGVGVKQSFSWRFLWVAPAHDIGDVLFFASANMANGDGTAGGDLIYNTTPNPLAVSRGGG